MPWICALLEFFSRPLLRGLLGLFGHDPDWEPLGEREGRSRGGWRRVLGIFLCCAVEGLFLYGLALLGALAYQ